MNMITSIRRMGNSQGVIIPAHLLRQLNFGSAVDLVVENDSLVLRKPANKRREGWADDAKQLAQQGDDALVWPEFSNSQDEDWVW
jgi:antitoxin MazE